MARWDEYLRIKSNTCMSIENILDPKRSSIVKDNREYLKMLLEFHRYFCLEELPYRGYDETRVNYSCKLERIYSNAAIYEFHFYNFIQKIKNTIFVI